MACELTTGRALDCKDAIGGVKAVYFCQLEDATITSSNGAICLSIKNFPFAGLLEKEGSGVIRDV